MYSVALLPFLSVPSSRHRPRRTCAIRSTTTARSYPAPPNRSAALSIRVSSDASPPWHSMMGVPKWFKTKTKTTAETDSTMSTSGTLNATLLGQPPRSLSLPHERGRCGRWKTNVNVGLRPPLTCLNVFTCAYWPSNYNRME